LLTVVLIAMCGDFHKAIAHPTTSPDAAVDNDLQNLAEQLDLLTRSLNLVRQENFEIVAYLMAAMGACTVAHTSEKMYLRVECFRDIRTNVTFKMQS